MQQPTVLEQKRRAAEEFTQRLLSSEVRDAVAKVVLFGSVRKGSPRPDSDVDLLVIATRALEQVTERCLDIAFETNLDLGQSIEPLVYGLNELRFPGSYFVYHNLKTGEEVYAMDEERLRWEESRGYRELAEEYVRGARNSLNSGDCRLAADGAYNAAELCVKGLLRLKLEKLPSSHSGFVIKFGELYVRPGLLPQELERSLNRSLWLGNQARYKLRAQIGAAEAQEVLSLAEALIRALAEALPI